MSAEYRNQLSVHDHPCAKLDGKIDSEIKPLVEALRSQPWLTTSSSCCGHGNGYAYVELIASEGMLGVKALVEIMNSIQSVTDLILDLSLNWSEEVYDSCDFDAYPDFTMWALRINAYPGNTEDWPSAEELKQLAGEFGCALINQKTGLRVRYPGTVTARRS